MNFRDPEGNSLNGWMSHLHMHEHRSEKLHGNADDLRRAPWNKCKVNNCVDVDYVSSVNIDD